MNKYPFAIRPHEKAPIFGAESDPQLVLKQLISEMSSPNFETSEKIRAYIRQAGLVSLFFYLKVIAGTTGPYSKLTNHLHLDMCNFRQSDYCMAPGARFGGFLGRGHYKTTVFTHGANGWEVIRDPDIRIGLFNAKEDRAYEFLGVVMDTFKSNEFFAWLYPEFVIPRGQASFIVPCRTRKFPEPNIKVGSTGSAGAGDHFDYTNDDDIVSEQDLDGMGGAGSTMTRKKTFLSMQERSMLVDWKVSRMGIIGTRYAIDDPYQEIFDHCKKFVGYIHPDFKENPSGNWTIYYRKGIEDGKVIFPESFTKEKYEELLEKDYWQYQTQYMNDPQQSGLSEFAKLEVKHASLLTDKDGRYVIFRKKQGNYQDDKKTILLSDCHVVMGIDPAFSDRGISAKTSRTAITVWAMDVDENCYLIKSKVGYFNIIETFGHIGDIVEDLYGYMSKIILESNAAQKALKPLLEKALAERDLFITIDPKPVTKDKDVRIRADVGRILFKGKAWVCSGAGIEFIEEVKVFPQSESKKDVLDASQKAIMELRKPMTQEDYYLMEEAELEAQMNVSNVTG